MKRVLKVFLVAFVLLSLTGCSDKKAISEEDFNSKLAKLDYFVNDITEYMEDNNVKSVYTANNNKIQLEFYTFKTKELAEKAYENNKKIFMENKDYEGKEKTSDSYKRYTQETDLNYNFVELVDNTVLYASVNPEYKNLLNKAISEIGY